jgi:hypothetical protein
VISLQAVHVDAHIQRLHSLIHEMSHCLSVLTRANVPLSRDLASSIDELDTLLYLVEIRLERNYPKTKHSLPELEESLSHVSKT